MKRTRKHFTAQEKMTLLRRHLVDKVPVSTVCEEAKLEPSVSIAGSSVSSKTAPRR